ncbi:hypothetical protein D3C78_1313390 [compost metagenome]
MPAIRSLYAQLLRRRLRPLRRLALIHMHHHRHARRKLRRKRLIRIDRNPHAETLGDLHEITRRIVRLDDGEFRTRCGRKPLHMAGQLAAMQGIHGDRYGLAHLHAGKLGFLEIGDDPDIVRHDGHQLCSGGDILTSAHADLAEPAIHGSVDFGIGEIDPGELDGGLGIGDGRLQRAAVDDDGLQILPGNLKRRLGLRE